MTIRERLARFAVRVIFFLQLGQGLFTLVQGDESPSPNNVDTFVRTAVVRRQDPGIGFKISPSFPRFGSATNPQHDGVNHKRQPHAWPNGASGFPSQQAERLPRRNASLQRSQQHAWSNGTPSFQSHQDLKPRRNDSFSTSAIAESALNISERFSMRFCHLRSFKQIEEGFQRRAYMAPRTHKLRNVQVYHITKAGSSTIRKTIEGQIADLDHPPDGLKEGHPGPVPTPPSRVLRKLPKVAFVRDPIERFESAFLEVYLCRQSKNNNSRPLGTGSSGDALQRNYEHFTQLFVDGGLRFVNFTAQLSIEVAEHFRSQTQSVCYPDGTCPDLDFLGRTETLNEDWNRAIPEFGWAFMPLKLNMRSRQHRTGTRMVGNCGTTVHKLAMHPSHTKRLCQIYRNDFCCFGLDFPEACRGMVCEDMHADALYGFI